MFKILLFLMTGITLYAHSQTPIIYGGKEDKFDSISLTQTKIVPISIQNLNNFKQKYSITINGEPVGRTSFILKGERRNIKIPVKIQKPNKLKTYKICTTSIPNNKEMFNTKICTKAYLYWAKKKNEI